MAIVTKMDIAAAVEFDREKATKSILSVRPGMEILHLSAKTGEGMAEWLRFLRQKTQGRSLVAAS
jgi:hydrogenase nickel incorporation protein HypB